MAITSRQFEHLSEMGISLWQSNATTQHTQTNGATNHAKIAHLQPNLAELSKQAIFTDILLSLNLSLGEIKQQKDHLDAGLFNWYFYTATPSANTKEQYAHIINYQDNALFSPSIEKIALSATLKKQLWHTIAGNLL